MSDSNSVIINVQYIKDLSFENPRFPHRINLQEEPEIFVTLDVAVQAVNTNVFEVMLNVLVEGKANDENLFIVDLHYGGVFTVDMEDAAEREKTLLVRCPHILFPYARRVISDTTRDGGFMPIMLQPIDFMDLYLKRKSEMEAKKSDDDDKTIN